MEIVGGRVTNLPSPRMVGENQGEAHLAMMGSSSDGLASMSLISSGRSYASIGSIVKIDD